MINEYLMTTKMTEGKRKKYEMRIRLNLSHIPVIFLIIFRRLIEYKITA